MRGQCDASRYKRSGNCHLCLNNSMDASTPTVTFQPSGHYYPLTGTNLLIEAHGREQLACGCYLKVERPEIEPVTFDLQIQHHNHHTTMQLRPMSPLIRCLQLVIPSLSLCVSAVFITRLQTDFNEIRGSS